MKIDRLKKLDLCWSKSCIGNESGNIVISCDYLYMPERFSECFWVLFERLNYTHDYCLHQLITSEQKLNELREEAKEYPDSEDHYYWEFNVDVISKSTILIMMSSFIEWGLKRVIMELVGSIPKKKNRIVSNVEYYIDLLKTNTLIGFEISDDTSNKLSELRKLRNKFAHGEWEKIEPLLKSLTFREIFTAISDLFFIIEELAWKSEWGNIK